LLSASEGKSKLEVQAMTAMHLPPVVIRSESVKIKAVSKTSIPADAPLFQGQMIQAETKAPILQYNFSVEVDDEFMRLYEEAKRLIGHIPASTLLKRALKEFVGKRSSVKRKASRSKTKNRRFIPKSVKVEVRKRDVGQCT